MSEETSHTNGHTDTVMDDASDVQASAGPTAEELKTEGNTFYKAGKYALAVQSYTKALDLDESNVAVLGNRAAALMLLGDFEKALQDSLKADTLAPGVAKTQNRIAQAQAQLQLVHQAQQFIEQKNPGMSLHLLDRLQKSLAPSATIPRQWQRLRAEALFQRGDIEQAGKYASDILRYDRTDVDALVLRGRVMYIQGDCQTAVNHFQEALRLDPDKSIARTLFKRAKALEAAKSAGNAKFKVGKMAEAEALFTEALAIDEENQGTNAKLYSNRATCRLRLKKYDAALEDCEQALALDSAYKKPLITRAKVFIAQERYQEAVDILKEASEQSPNDETIDRELRSAELELAKSKRKNYYKILGIEKDAGDSEIKKAYRKAALVNHPDKNPDDPEAEARFKDVGEAYAILSDPQKKYQYDSGADLEQPGMGGMGGGMGGMDPNDIFRMFAQQQGGGGGFSGFGHGSGHGGGGHAFHGF
jgi:DnaJ family protein C protein 7